MGASPINRRVTRTQLENPALTFSEKTASTITLNGSTIPFELLTTDKFYVGFYEPFTTRHFSLGVVNTDTTVVGVKFFDGTSFVAVEDLLDQTDGFKKSGFISWQNPGGWETRDDLGKVLEVDIFWIEITVSVALSAGTTLEAVTNLWSDDTLLRGLYPELITDSTYLPVGRTDFLEQHQAAKQLVVTRLKQKRIIVDESEVIDINEVAEVTTHACAWIILDPLANSDASVIRADRARRRMDDEIKQINFAPDVNNDGIVDETERREVFSVGIRRR